MSHWNHRVVKHVKTAVIDNVEETETWFSIHEVFYDDNGHPNAYTEDAVEPFGETLLELSDDIQRFADALSKPVLVHADFFPTRESEHARDIDPDAVEADRIALTASENEAWMALGGVDTHLGHSEAWGMLPMPVDIGTSASASALIEKLQGFRVTDGLEDVFPHETEEQPTSSNGTPIFKVFPAPTNRHDTTAQKETGTEIPCPFCKGRVLPRKEWLTGTWCCDKQYKARGLQSY